MATPVALSLASSLRLPALTAWLGLMRDQIGVSYTLFNPRMATCFPILLLQFQLPITASDKSLSLIRIFFDNTLRRLHFSNLDHVNPPRLDLVFLPSFLTSMHGQTGMALPLAFRFYPHDVGFGSSLFRSRSILDSWLRLDDLDGAMYLMDVPIFHSPALAALIMTFSIR